MKRLLFVSLIASLFVGVTSVSAMTESELEEKLTQTITINGTEVTLPDATKDKIRAYLKQYDVSSSDADYISQKIDTAINIVKSEGKTDFKELSTSAKEKLKEILSDLRVTF